MRTFTKSINEETVLPGEENEIFRADGSGLITHMWFGGSYETIPDARLNIYYGAEETPSVSAKLYLMHGIGFGDKGSFQTSLVGKTGEISGIYNRYPIPYQNGVRVTLTISPEEKGAALFWSIVRATEGMELMLGGTRAVNPRFVLCRTENFLAKPLEEFTIYQSAGRQGCLFLTAMSAKSRNLEYQEACFRGYFDGEMQLLSSGMEDYFLGTYYFQNGKYQTDLAGVTHFVHEEYPLHGLTGKPTEFSGYRFHNTDPVFFPKDFRMTLRCGERLRDYTFHNPQETEYNVYVFAYEFDALV